MDFDEFPEVFDAEVAECHDALAFLVDII